MPVSWTTAVIIGLITAGIHFFVFIIKIYQYLKTKYLQELLFVIFEVLFVGFASLQALAYLYLSVELFHLSYIVASFFSYALMRFIDLISRETIDPIKSSLITGMSVAMVFSSFFPNSFYIAPYPNGELGVFTGGYFRIIMTLSLTIISLIFVYYAFKIYLKAPKKLKFYSGIFLLGVIVFGVVPGITTLIGLTLTIPALHLLIITIGVLIVIVVLFKEHKIAYILPFKAMRLAVIEIDKGILLYNYDWIKEEEISEKAVFSAMIHTVTKFIEEKLQKGKILEIHLENVKLTLVKKEGYPVTCVLISDKSTQSLKNALNCFSDRFFKKYSQYLSKPSDVEQFKTANDLISKCFSFIPNYN